MSSVEKVPETFKVIAAEEDTFIEPVTVKVLPAFKLKSMLALSSTVSSEKVAPEDPLNIMDPLAGVMIISLLYTGTGYKYFIGLFLMKEHLFFHL